MLTEKIDVVMNEDVDVDIGWNCKTQDCKIQNYYIISTDKWRWWKRNQWAENDDILLRLSKDETTKEIIALRRTGTSATEGKRPLNRKARDIYAGKTEN